MAAKNCSKLTNSTLRETHSRILDAVRVKNERDCVSMWTLLTEIDIGNSGDCSPTVRPNNTISEGEIIPPASDVSPWHPVTLLYRICSDLQWPTPTYELISEEVNATKHIFTLECKVLHYRAIGEGLSKRKAKRAASKALLENLKDHDDFKKYAGFIYSQMYIYEENETNCISEDGFPVNATSELYKMCYSRRWPLPVYGVLSVEGPVHNRNFTVGCTMPGLSELVEGKGHTKKEAKQAASLALLNKVLANTSTSPFSTRASNFLHDRKHDHETSFKHISSKNATSLLNEMCMLCSWPRPIYEYLPISNSVSRRLFTVGCSLLGHSESGTGYTKKEAKHAASAALLLKVREYLEEPYPLFNQNAICKKLNKSKHFFDTSKDPITSLHEVCASQNWPHPNYKLLAEDELPDNKKIFTIGCFVLGRTPLVKGSGSSKKIAKHVASQALLDLLKSDDGICDSSIHLHTNSYIYDVNHNYKDTSK